LGNRILKQLQRRLTLSQWQQRAGRLALMAMMFFMSPLL